MVKEISSRIELQRLFEDVLGSRNVYFQPPETKKMSYPAIVYSRSSIRSKFADDGVYKLSHLYDVTLIDRNPDSEIIDKIASLPHCRYDRHYVADNLNHDTFTIFY